MVIVYGECWVNVGVKGCQIKKKIVTLPCKLLCVTIYNFVYVFLKIKLNLNYWSLISTHL